MIRKLWKICESANQETKTEMIPNRTQWSQSMSYDLWTQSGQSYTKQSSLSLPKGIADNFNELFSTLLSKHPHGQVCCYDIQLIKTCPNKTTMYVKHALIGFAKDSVSCEIFPKVWLFEKCCITTIICKGRENVWGLSRIFTMSVVRFLAAFEICEHRDFL